MAIKTKPLILDEELEEELEGTEKKDAGLDEEGEEKGEGEEEKEIPEEDSY